ncbi:prephenate dehydrogenase [Methanococcoides orientis]|uniref:prephenate dehydrogenase n=1 Tax=Methanococcoides orientis TaxID=2822137 RepID=UPI001E4DD7E5|nr:prephenate dehydrogenase [Methanococcoides orientis]UGV40603.1 prephenate dehydrogenase [Methanococcoides orientis]
MRMLIIGGTGGMGQWFTKFFLRHGYEVIVWGSSGKTEIADQMGVEFATDLDREIRRADVVVITVPIDITARVIKETAPKMKPGSLIMDLTSIKAEPVNTMREYAPEGVEILGTHPMFGPSIPTLQGQIVIMSPTKGRCDKWFPIMHDLFEQSGAHIEIIDPQEHDQFVSVVQGLTHFAYITIGTTFKSLDFDVSKSRRFMSPVYEIMVDFVGRILGQNPYLYAHIQMKNDQVLKVHEAFINECNVLSDIVRQEDTEAFCKKMTEAAAHFKDTASALHRSDKLINAKIAEFEEMIASVGKERGLLHNYSGVTHVGIIEKVTPRTVTLSKGDRTVSLRTENIRLLNDAELKKWKIDNLTHHARDISVLIPVGANPQIIEKVIDCDERIVSVSIIDTYSGISDDRLSVTYRINILGDLPVAEVQGDIEKLFVGLGCGIRGQDSI